MIEPKSRTVEPERLMASLFRQSDLETRFPINLNVLNAGGAPVVVGLKAALEAFLDHRQAVLARRAGHRLERLERRLHVLDALLIVFLDLDEVIRIVRFEAAPKAKLVAAFDLTEVQAEAILDTRLRHLARLEEAQLRREHEELLAERDGIAKLLASPAAQRKLVGVGLADVRRALGPKTPLGRRRSSFAEAPEPSRQTASDEAGSGEPITVILSARGWLRAARGHLDDPATLSFKEGDGPAFLIKALTSDKILLLASDGRAYTLAGDDLPSGRGHGEPLRLIIDLAPDADILAAFVPVAGGRRVLLSTAGYGFAVAEQELLSARRAGRQVMNVGDGAVLACLAAEGDHLAVVGDNRKALIFPLADLPALQRGKGVKVQSYRDGGLRDGLVFVAEAGPSWLDAAGRMRAWPDWRAWLGRRAAAGRLAPRGFPASGRFSPDSGA